MDYEYPTQTPPDPRFFVVPYHEETLVGNANQSSASGAFSEVLSEFLKEYFTAESGKDCWSGTALQMHKQIMADPTMGLIMHRYDPGTIGRQLSALANKNIFDIKIDSIDGTRIFVICRGERYSSKKPVSNIVLQAQNSNFQK
jgi:hypothetical protein